MKRLRSSLTLAWLVLVPGGCSSAQTPAIKPSIDPGRLRTAPRFSAAVRYLDSAIAAGAAPGAVLAVSHHGEWFIHGTGRLGLDDPTVPDSTTIYDLASLTKVVGLTTAMMLAVDSGLIDLEAPIQRYVPGFTGRHKERVTVRHLLVHASGLPDWRPLFRETASRDAALALADTTPLDTLPGARYLYSDIGIIVLTQAIETVFHQRLDSLLSSRVFPSIRMNSTGFLPPPEWLPRIAPTENDPWRGRILRGEVHDENTARMDGVSGHAGLFGSAPDLLRFGEWILWLISDPQFGMPASRIVSEEWLRFQVRPSFFRRQGIPPGSHRTLGWETPTGGNSAGSLLHPSSIGHTGFTGTSIWIDPTRELVIVLLTNRVHPTRANNRMGPVRRGVADRVVRGLRESW